MPPKYLVIVRRGEDALYAQLTSQWQEAGITVIWDRRYGERRRTAPRDQGFRRRADRRRAPPDTWVAMGFLVLPAEHPS